MKSFFNFLSEARKTKASERAKELGLTSAGGGRWVDRSGKYVAQTQDGVLKMVQPGTKGPGEEDGAEAKKREAEKASENRPAVKSAEDQAAARKKANPEADDVNRSPSEDTVTLVFGRFNPPTVGHKKLLDAAAQVAGNGDMRVYPSRSQDPKKNPLDPDEKANLMRKMFPDHKDSIVNDSDVRTIFDAMKIADEEGYKNVNIVVGSDRVSEFENLANKYNGKLYNFDDIEVISAGERDDGEGVSGMSASKMRKAAAESDFDTFRKGVPEVIDDKMARTIMRTVRNAMEVTTAESWNLWEIAPRFDWKNLRENYVTGKIFKLDSLVENLKTGLVGKVVRRGANHIICVTEDDVMFKSWIKDLKEYTEVKMSRKQRVPGKPNTLAGTDGYFKYAADMTPGFDKGDKTNLQPGGKPYKGPKSNIREFLNRYRKRRS